MRRLKFFLITWSFSVGRNRSQDLIKKLYHFFIIIKTLVIPLENSANLPAPNSPNFKRLALLMLWYKNGSKKFLWPFETYPPTHTEGPNAFEKNVFTLMYVLFCTIHSNFNLTEKSWRNYLELQTYAIPNYFFLHSLFY